MTSQAQNLKPALGTLAGCAGGQPMQPGGAAAAQRDTQLWAAWLLGCLAVPLLRAHFYATETEPGRQAVSYYRYTVL
jgi:Telomerase ribonucleoprotein complex - RNA binding domain